jgi:hypothetical protein
MNFTNLLKHRSAEVMIIKKLNLQHFRNATMNSIDLKRITRCKLASIFTSADHRKFLGFLELCLVLRQQDYRLLMKLF